ncbi:hypothetical protein ABZ897_12570 [Nonomuraea sp. NPDC046802]|uniref:hypothetical protein n=1 Tax=Nonomuraea sp. NPDC046802 TaxID=3154919 RepID=UPI0033DC9269
MIATFRYAFGMQVRRRSLWIVYGLVFAVIAARMPFWTLDMGYGEGQESWQGMATAAGLLTSLLPLVHGCMLADRPVRDRVLRVAPILDATPTSRTARQMGAYAGACAATAVPFAVVYFGRALLFVVMEGQPSAIGWAVLNFLGSIVPGLVFLGALAFAGPLLVPPMVFRVLFVAYWFWGNLIPKTMMPTISDTIFDATGDYVRYGLLAPPTVDYGPGPPAMFDFLRPAYSPGTAVLWIGVMIALSAVMLFLLCLHASRSES